MSGDKEILDMSDSSINIRYTMDEYLRMLNNDLKNTLNIIIRSADSLSFKTELNSCNYDQVIQLKSQLKYCKNYMQRLNINRELNKLYKDK